MTDTVLTEVRRATLAALVDTFVAEAPHDAHLTVGQYLTASLPAEQLAGILQLIDVFVLVGLKNQPQHIREVAVGVVAGISPETAAGVGAMRKLALSLTGAPAHE
jgi:hypothetical protein